MIDLRNLKSQKPIKENEIEKKTCNFNNVCSKGFLMKQLMSFNVKYIAQPKLTEHDRRSGTFSSS